MKYVNLLWHQYHWSTLTDKRHKSAVVGSRSKSVAGKASSGIKPLQAPVTSKTSRVDPARASQNPARAPQDPFAMDVDSEDQLASGAAIQREDRSEVGKSSRKGKEREVPRANPPPAIAVAATAKSRDKPSKQVRIDVPTHSAQASAPDAPAKDKKNKKKSREAIPPLPPGTPRAARWGDNITNHLQASRQVPPPPPPPSTVTATTSTLTKSAPPPSMSADHDAVDESVGTPDS